MRSFIAILTITALLYSCNKSDNQCGTNNSKGAIKIVGKAIFVLGNYHLPANEKPFTTLEENGINLIRLSANKSELDSASSLGLNAWVTLGIIDTLKRKESLERILSIVEEFKDHPALFAWELFDEPAFSWNSAECRMPPGPMIDTYNEIKKIDPVHPVYLNHAPVNLVSTMRKYNPSNDITACDVYPVIPYGIKPTFALFNDGLQGDLLNPYISQVGEYVDKMRNVTGPDRPLIIILQGFAWEMLKPEKERDPSMILYPTFEQSWFMAWNAIIHGANGLLWWGNSYTPPEHPFHNDLGKVTKRLRDLEDVIVAHSLESKIELEYHELGYSVDAGVEFLVKETEKGTWILAANADRYPVKVTFKTPVGSNNLEVLYEERGVKIKDGNFTDTFKAFGVHIYFIVK
jgi:hypothetical protein